MYKRQVLTDLNGDAWPDLVVAMNGSEALAFEQAPLGGSKVMTVDLRGADARRIGAFLTMELDSGKKLSKEVYAGGGYLSQSSININFVVPEGEIARALIVRWGDGKLTRQEVGEGESKIKVVY